MKNRILHTMCLTIAMCVIFIGSVSADDQTPSEIIPKDVTITGIQVEPAQIAMIHRFDYRQLLLTATTDQGYRFDITRLAKIDKGTLPVEITTGGLLRPTGDGSGKINITFQGKTASIKFASTGFAAPRKVSFIQDVSPVMTKMGCSAGTCHGAAKGKAGFKLSLRGYDPASDHTALTDDIGSRRTNRAAPAQSLMLLKATGQIPHIGGVLTEPGKPKYKMLRDWVAQGIQLDLGTPEVISIELFPKNPIVPLAEMRQQFRVIATYSDGKKRDVTGETFISSGNIEVALANKTGVVTTLRRGEAPVLARYEGSYAATIVTVMGDRTGFKWNNPPTHNYIDRLVYEKLKRVKSLPSEICTDAEFIRRVYLDLTGLPPSSDAVRSFLADKKDQKTKRDALVDQLIGNPEYIEHWTNKWADLLQVNRKFLGQEGSAAFRGWIQNAVATNMPYDKFVHKILTASGSNQKNPPASYFKRLRDPGEAIENTTQLFLAIRFSCNKCHDHPFERWTQSQYYHLSAYFAQVGLKTDPTSGKRKIGGSAVEGAKPLFEIIFDKTSGDVKHLATGQVAAPQFPFEHADKMAAGASRRKQLAHWITSKKNPYFAKSYVNRLWGYLFGIGIIEPIDDSRAGNPPTNPELLDALAKEFIESDFNVQQMLTRICKSRTYQHSISPNKWNEDDEINYSHAIARRLPAEVLYDAIHRSTGTPLEIPGIPAGFRAAQIPDAGVRVPFLDDFGRPARESACECERTSGVLLAPVLKLINGPTVSNAVSHPKNAIAKLVAEQQDDKKLIEELYLRMLARPPTEKEIAIGIGALNNDYQSNAKRATAALAAYEKTFDAKQQDRETSVGTIWHPLPLSEFKGSGGAKFTKLPDGSLLVASKADKETYTVAGSTPLSGITGIRLELLAHDSLPAKGPGQATSNGNLVLNELKLSAGPKADAKNNVAVQLKNATTPFSQNGFPVTNAVDGNPSTGWAIAPQFGKNHLAIFETAKDVAHPGGSRLTLVLDQTYGSKHMIGRFKISVTSSPRPLREAGLPPKFAAILAIPREKRTKSQAAELTQYFRSLDPRWKQLKSEADQVVADLKNGRLYGAQDLAWALINSPSFLFNR